MFSCGTVEILSTAIVCKFVSTIWIRTFVGISIKKLHLLLKYDCVMFVAINELVNYSELYYNIYIYSK